MLVILTVVVAAAVLLEILRRTRVGDRRGFGHRSGPSYLDLHHHHGSEHHHHAHDHESFDGSDGDCD